MQNAPVKSEFGATATCFVNFFDFCEICIFFKTLFDVTMSLISKNGSGGAGQKRIWSHGDLFRELFYFCEILCFCNLLSPSLLLKYAMPLFFIEVLFFKQNW